MEARAISRHVRVTPRKVRLVADEVRGKKVGDALAMLKYTPQAAAEHLSKLLRSAVANAEQKNEREKAGLDVDNLVVRTVLVDEGPSQWRISPRAQGRAYWIQRRSHHVTVVLAER